MKTIITHLSPKEFFENNGKVLFSFQKQVNEFHLDKLSYQYEEAKTLEEFNTLFTKHFHLIGSSDFIIFGGIINEPLDVNENTDFNFFEDYSYELYKFDYDSVCFEICGGKNYLDNIYIRYSDVQKEQHTKAIQEEDDAFNLDYNVALYILPRLQQFRKNVFSYPYGFTIEEWEEIIDKMIKAFQMVAFEYLFVDYEKLMSKDKDVAEMEKKRIEQNDKDKKEGLELFAKHFKSLWK